MPQGERTVCVTDVFLFFVIPPHRQPHTVLGGLISLSGGWILLCKELLMAEDSLHITMQGIERIKYKVSCMCFSAINGSGPAYLSELLHVCTPSRTLRSSSDTRMLEIQ